MKRFLSIVLAISTLVSVLCTPSFAIESSESVQSTRYIREYSHEFTLDLGDANFQYFIFTPEDSVGSCLVNIYFTDMNPAYDGASVQIEWESKLSSETQFKPMGYGDIVEYGQGVYFQMPLSMIRNYRLKITNLDYPNGRYLASFLMTYGFTR